MKWLPRQKQCLYTSREILRDGMVHKNGEHTITREMAVNTWSNLVLRVYINFFSSSPLCISRWLFGTLPLLNLSGWESEKGGVLVPRCNVHSTIFPRKKEKKVFPAARVRFFLSTRNGANITIFLFRLISSTTSWNLKCQCTLIRITEITFPP